MSTPVCPCGHRRHHGRPSPSWRPGISFALITGYLRRHHGRLPIPREHHVEPEFGFVPVLSDGTASRLGILVNGERESHVPDRLSKNLTFCAETTAHVIQRHDDGRTFQRESSELHGLHTQAGRTHLLRSTPAMPTSATLEKSSCKGPRWKSFSARSRSVRSGLRTSDRRAVKVSVSPKRQRHLLNRPLSFGVKSPSSVVLCTDASDTFCITWGA